VGATSIDPSIDTPPSILDPLGGQCSDVGGMGKVYNMQVSTNITVGHEILRENTIPYDDIVSPPEKIVSLNDVLSSSPLPISNNFQARPISNDMSNVTLRKKPRPRNNKKVFGAIEGGLAPLAPFPLVTQSLCDSMYSPSALRACQSSLDGF